MATVTVFVCTKHQKYGNKDEWIPLTPVVANSIFWEHINSEEHKCDECLQEELKEQEENWRKLNEYMNFC